MKLNILPASAGLEWIRLGWRTFRKQPLALSALFFLGMAFVSIVGMIPIVGTALALALLPTVSLVMMVGAAQTWQQRVPTPELIMMVLRTSKERQRALVQLGVCYAIGFALVMLVTTLVDGGSFAQVYLGMEPLTPELAQSAEFQSAMLVAALLYLPLSLLFWHAPALVHWHNTPALKALFFSFVACKRNLGAFLVYGLGWLGIFMVGGLMIGLVVSAFIIAFGGAASALMVVAALALAAVFFTSVVFSFQACFSL